MQPTETFEQPGAREAALGQFISNPLTSTQNAYIKVGSLIERLKTQANNGCGQFYELYESRLLGSLRNVAEKLGEKDREVFERGALAKGLKFDDEAIAAASSACAEMDREMSIFQGLDEDEDYEAIAFYESLSDLDRDFGPALRESAALEGWAISECPNSEHGLWQVLKIDSAELFAVANGFSIPQLETDEQAWLIVLGGERIHHEAARIFIENYNPAMWKRMEQFRDSISQPRAATSLPRL